MNSSSQDPPSLEQLLDETNEAINESFEDLSSVVDFEKVAALVDYYINPFNDPKIANRRRDIINCLSSLKMLDVKYTFDDEKDAIRKIAKILKYVPNIERLVMNNKNFSYDEFSDFKKAVRQGKSIQQLIKLADVVNFKDTDPDPDFPNERTPVVVMKIDSLPLDMPIHLGGKEERTKLRLKYALKHADELDTSPTVIAVLQLLPKSQAYIVARKKIDVIDINNKTVPLLMKCLGQEKFDKLLSEKIKLNYREIHSPASTTSVESGDSPSPTPTPSPRSSPLSASTPKFAVSRSKIMSRSGSKREKNEEIIDRHRNQHTRLKAPKR